VSTLVRYKQTVIGVAWAVIRPLLTILIGAGIFGSLAKLPSDGVPYAIMVCAGTLPWYFFASALSESSGSLVGNANLISKIYFPRMILPASAVVVAFVDFAISMLILAGLMAWYWHGALMAALRAAVVHAASLPQRHGSWTALHRAECEVSRLPLHHPLRRAVRPLRVARVLQHHRDSGSFRRHPAARWSHSIRLSA